MVLRAVLLLLMLALPARSAAQVHFAGDEFVAGAGANILLRGPWVAPAWRQPVPRAVLFTGISVGYELFMDPSRWRADHRTWVDIGERAGSYAVTELVLWLWRR